MEALIDTRTGVVRGTVRLPAEQWWPSGLDIVVADVADMMRHLPWPADRVATGTAFADPEHAHRAAVGEAVERYCGNFVPAGLRRASHRQLLAAGEHAVDPTTLALHSPAQYAQPDFPFQPFTGDLEVLWTTGYRLSDGIPTAVPASLVYVNWLLPPRADEPRTNFSMLSGLAAGPTRAAAETAALEEVIERDATVVWWANRIPARPVDVAHPALARLLVPDPERGSGWARAAGTSADIRYRVVAIPTVFDVSVLGVLIDDPELQITALGVAARPEPAAAVAKALAEAVTLRRYALGLLDPDGEIWQAAGAGLIDGTIFHPWRADRSYTRSYRPDWSDVLDLGCHGQLWLDPAMRAHLDPITGGEEVVRLDDLPHLAGDIRAGYLRRLAGQDIEAVAVDVTTPDAEAAGVAVVRVVAPGTYGNPPAAFPFLGGSRLYTDPVRLGLRTAPLAEADVNRVPLPHT
ncbi:YcaO-like family protein [Plantactinospora sp. WMMC1484]|uniref:YcaO-like family protein n=1 Tax=Plantactinospora sp. WMMC1484 TaxID=3404122 RepID=UPI003BF55C54